MAEKKAKPKQGELEEIAETVHKIPAVTKAARKYVDARDERAGALEHEKDAKARLIATMKEHGVRQYRAEDIVATLTEKDAVSVKRLREVEPAA